MAKISELPEVVAPVGTETAVVLSGGRAKRARLDLLATAAAAPSVALAQLASASAVAAAARFFPFKTPPEPDSDRSHLISLDLLPSINGVAVTLPPDWQQFELVRDSFDRMRISWAWRDEADVAHPLLIVDYQGGAYIDATGMTGVREFDVYSGSIITGHPIGTWLGTALILTDGPFGTYYPYSIPFNEGEIDSAKTMPRTGTLAVTNELINNALDAYSRRDRGVFIASVKDNYLRDLITRFAAEEGDAEGRYGLSLLETIRYPGNFDRIRIIVHDYWLGIDAGQHTFQSASGETLDPNTLPKRFIVSQGNLSHWHGAQFYFEVDWSKIDWTYGAKSFTTWAQAGFEQANTSTTEMVDADFIFGGPKPRRVITVDDADADFTTVRAAIVSLHRTDIGVIDGSNQPISWECCYSHQVKIIDRRKRALVEDLQGVFIPDYLTIEVEAAPGLVEYARASSGGRNIEANGSYRFINVTQRMAFDDYATHSDENNQRARAATLGPAWQRWHPRQIEERCTYILEPGQSEWGRGAGFSSGARVLILYPTLERRGSAPNAFLAWHDLPNTVEGGWLKIVGLKATVNSGGGAEVALLSSFPSPYRHSVIIEDPDGAGILVAAAANMPDNDAAMQSGARQRIGWDIRVIGDAGAVTVDMTDPKMRVASTTPGIAVGGAGAALLGRYDRTLGRWDGLLLDGSIWSLANRFGDCRAAPKPITIGAQVWPGNGDYRDLSEAAILAQINAALTANPIVPVRIDGEILN